MRLLRKLSILTIVVAAATGVAAGALIRPVAKRLIPPAIPIVYFSSGTNLCFGIGGVDYSVFVHSPHDTDLYIVSFDLEFDANVPVPPIVIPQDGVILGNVDVSTPPYHIEALWTWRPLDHEPIVRLFFPSEPLWNGYVTPTNVVFTRTSGNTLPGDGWSTFGCCADCFPCQLHFYVDDHVVIPAGESVTIPFEWQWWCHSGGGSLIDVVDTEGWVTSWSPISGGSNEHCFQCIISVHPGSIEVTVPDGVVEGTMSTLTLSGLNNSRTVILEATEPVPVDQSTWGAIKALYR